MINKGGLLIFLLYLVFGFYFINSPFNFVQIPDFVSKFNVWITFAGGLLLLLGGINYMRIPRTVQ